MKSRPQKYDPSLGFQGNLEDVLWETQYRKNEISNEVGARKTSDRENREAVEQLLTDQYLDGVQAQQDITDLMLEVAALKGE